MTLPLPVFGAVLPGEEPAPRPPVSGPVTVAGVAAVMPHRGGREAGPAA